MKRYFETPAIEFSSIDPDMDVMAVSAQMVKGKTNMQTVSDEKSSDTPTIWMGADSWI